MHGSPSLPPTFSPHHHLYTHQINQSIAMGCTASSFEANKRLVANKGRRRPFPTTLSRKKLLSHREDMKISVSSRPSDCAAPPPYSLEQIITGNTPPKANSQEIKIEAMTKGSVGIAIIISANNCGLMKVVTPEDNDEKEKKSPKLGKKEVKFVNIDEDDDEDENEDEDDGRRIGFEEGQASPSFRVYFDENRKYSLNQETVKYGDAFTERVPTGDINSTKEVITSHHVEKKVKRDRKKRCFRKVLVLPKKGSQADMKRILNMKSCYST